MAELDAHLQAPARLRLMAMVATVTQVEFVVLRDHLEVSDSVLSKHISTLTEAGYLKSRKGSYEGRRTTWVAGTARGRRVLSEHVAALREIIDAVE
jgi:DNA-binding MarR family transcriptional regulator